MNLRNLAIWGVIIVVLIGLYSMMTQTGRGAAATEITYSQLLGKVNSGSLKKAEISGSHIDVTDGANKTFGATTPNNQDDLVKRLESQNVDIKVKAPGGFTIGALLVQLLPILLLVGVWI